ncbi:MAG: LamG domain-containing protein [Bacteroidota bacterium]|nr:MAG: LamG domain-containing protein [Bacteroidota bacterium]
MKNTRRPVPGYALRMNPSRNIVVFSLGASNVCTPLISSGTVPLNQWSHVALTFTAGTLRVYINGVLNGTLTGQERPIPVPIF